MLFVFVFAIKLLLVCYSACSLSLNTFAFEEIIYRNKEIEISSTDINMTSPEEGRKWFSRSVASMTNICSWGTRFTIVPVLVCVTKIMNFPGKEQYFDLNLSLWCLPYSIHHHYTSWSSLSFQLADFLFMLIIAKLNYLVFLC